MVARGTVVWAAVVMMVVGAVPRQSSAQSKEQVKKWVDQLISEDASEQSAAQSALASCPADLSVPALVAATGDKDSRVRLAAAKVLSGIADPRAMPAVAKLLADPVVGLPQQIMLIFRQTRDKAMVAAAKDVFAKVDPKLQSEFLQLAFGVDPDAAGELVLQCLESKDAQSHYLGLQYLYQVRQRGPRLLPALKACLNDPKAAGRAAEKLGPLCGPQAVGPLTDFLMKSDIAWEISAAAEALVKLRGNAAAPDLVKKLKSFPEAFWQPLAMPLDNLCVPDTAEAIAAAALKNPSRTDGGNYVRLRACLTLGDCRNPKSVAPLCEVAKSDPSAVIRRAATYALGRLGDPAATDTLADMLTSDNYPQAEKDLVRGEKDTFETRLRVAREEAVLSLGMLPGAKADAAMTKALDHPQDSVRGAALALLAERGDKSILDRVIRGLADTNYLVAQGAVDACRSTDDPKVAGPLIELARSNRNAKTPFYRNLLAGGSWVGVYDDVFLRRHAMEVLADKWPDKALAPLAEIAAGGPKYDYAAYYAARALCRIDGHAAAKALAVYAMGDPRLEDWTTPDLFLPKLKLLGLETYLAFLDMYMHRKRPILSSETEQGLVCEDSWIEPLLAELKKPGGRVWAALAILGHASNRNIDKLIAPFLDPPDSDTGRIALTALVNLKSSLAVAPLVKRVHPVIVGNRDYNNTPQVIEALGKIGDKSAIGPLREVINDHFYGRIALVALANLGDRETWDAMVKKSPYLLEDSFVAGAFGVPRAVEPMRLQAEASHMPSFAFCQTIYQLQPDTAAPILGKIVRCHMTYENDGERVQKDKLDAIDLLRRLKKPDLIRPGLTDDFFAVRQAARKALAELANPTTRP